MTYTKEQRKEIHDQLVAAKPYLVGGHTTYICSAIAAGTGVPYHESNDSLAIKMITARLCSYHTVAHWLVHKNICSWTFISDNPGLIQTYRREWLDHLIKEFSE